MQVLFCVVIFFLPAHLLAALNFDRPIESESVVLINSKTGKVLWQKNPDLVCYPASTTKIATAFYALMQKPNALQEQIRARADALIAVSTSQKIQANYTKCPSFWLEKDCSHVGIKPGQVLTFEELLLANLIASGCDASNIIAQTVSGSIDQFMEGLNRFVRNLGCTSTHFCNPHGLHHPDHVSTARDMARLAQCAMYHPFIHKAVRQTSYEKPANRVQSRLLFVQTNKLLLPKGRHYYPHATGVKTGYTSKAGYALVAAAEKGDRSVIAAIFRAKDKDVRFIDAKTLFEACFQELQAEKLLLSAGDQDFSRQIRGASDTLQTYTKEPITLRFYPSEEPEIRSLLVWQEVELPMKAGTQVGEIVILADDKEAMRAPLYAKNDLEETFWARCERYFDTLLQAVIGHPVIALAVLVGLIFFFVRIRSRK